MFDDVRLRYCEPSFSDDGLFAKLFTLADVSLWPSPSPPLTLQDVDDLTAGDIFRQIVGDLPPPRFTNVSLLTCRSHLSPRRRSSLPPVVVTLAPSYGTSFSSALRSVYSSFPPLF